MVLFFKYGKWHVCNPFTQYTCLLVEKKENYMFQHFLTLYHTFNHMSKIDLKKWTWLDTPTDRH